MHRLCFPGCRNCCVGRMCHIGCAGGQRLDPARAKPLTAAARPDFPVCSTWLNQGGMPWAWVPSRCSASYAGLTGCQSERSCWHCGLVLLCCHVICRLLLVRQSSRLQCSIQKHPDVLPVWLTALLTHTEQSAQTAGIAWLLAVLRPPPDILQATILPYVLLQHLRVLQLLCLLEHQRCPMLCCRGVQRVSR